MKIYIQPFRINFKLNGESYYANVCDFSNHSVASLYKKEADNTYVHCGATTQGVYKTRASYIRNIKHQLQNYKLPEWAF